MSQLIFKFPFQKNIMNMIFLFLVIISAYKLIESWPTWPGKWLNIFGASGSGKTHF